MSEAITMSNDNNIKTVVEEGQWLTITTTDGRQVKTNIGTLNYNDLKQLGFNTQAPYEIKTSGHRLGKYIPYTARTCAAFRSILFFIFRAGGSTIRL